MSVATGLGAGNGEALGATLARASRNASQGAISEVLLQSVLFVGYPRVLNAFVAWRDSGALSGPVADDDAPAAGADARAPWAQRGRAVLARVYGGQQEQVVANVAAMSPALADWMVNDGYGKVLGRPGLDLATRELCIVALLAQQDAVPQVYSHLRGALNAGAAEGDVEEVLRMSLANVPAEHALRVNDVWQTVRNRRGE